jgi:leucyl-tRNA synthetase
MLVDDMLDLPISIQGKVRSRIRVAADADAATLEAAALADPRIRELIGEKPIRKLIVVPGKLINIVI